MKFVVLGLLAVFPLLSFAEVYKWVDSNGVTHYGSMKPSDTEAKKLKIDTRTPNVSSNSQIKTLPDGAQQVADSMTKTLLKDHGDSKELDCAKAVENAHYSIDSMLDVGERNYKGGYIVKSKYMEMTKNLKKARRQISLSECRSSRGNVKGFYTCMTNSYNHVMNCGKKYDYGD